MRHAAIIQLIVAGLLLAGSIGAYFFCYSLVERTSTEANVLAKDIRTKSQDSARIAVAKATLASLADDEASVQEYLVPTNEIVPFLESLEQTGKGFGAKVEVVSVSADRGEGQGRLALSLRITGPFDSVLRTLGAIEYGAYDSALTSLAFDTTSGDLVPEWNAAVTLNIGTREPANATQPKP